MTLAPNGDIEFFYDDFYAYSVFERGRNLFVAVADIEVNDPMVVTDADHNENNLFDSFMPGTAIKIKAPGKMMIHSLSAPSGVVAIGESKEIIAEGKATEGMYAGELMNSLVVLSNDPNQSTSYVEFKGNIIGSSLVPATELATNSIDFGTIFKTSDAKLPLLVNNTGTDVLTVTSVVFDNAKFTTATALPLEIAAGTSKDIVVLMSTEAEAENQGEMKISTADGKEFAVSLKGIVIGAPEIKVTPGEIAETVASGEPFTSKLSIQNTGNEALEYTIVPNSLFQVSDLSAADDTSIDYTFVASVDDKSVVFDWDAIEKDEASTQLKLAYWLYSDFAEVQLPYEIPFYGKNYDKIYIYGVGFVSFTKTDDYNEAPAPPTDGIPSRNPLYTNFIAPYWGHHFMDQTNTAGVYYQIKEDRVVISFMEYANSVNYGVCYQLIMYKDGKFKFQYKLANEISYWDGIYGAAGLQNEVGDKGFQLKNRCLAANSAVDIFPVKSGKLAANSQADINIDLLTDRMAGEYQSNIVLNTNVPTVPTMEVPLNITVTGQPNAVFPTEVVHEAVMGTTSGAGYLEVPFEISNTGTAEFVITDVDAPGMIGYEATVGMLFHYGVYFDDWFMEEKEGWSRYMPGSEITVGKEPAQFKVMVMDNYTIADYEVAMKFAVRGLDTETVEVPFKLSITDAPALMFADAETRISGVAADYRDQVEIFFGNIGNYKLNYTLELDPTGQGDETAGEAGGGGVMPMAKAQPSVLSEKMNASLVLAEQPAAASTRNSTKQSSPDLPADYSYNKALYHPIMPGSNQMYIVGSFNTSHQFQSATQFTAPADGFNLHSIYTHITIGNLTNVDVKVDIIQGSDINTGAVIGTGKISIDKEEPASVGADGVAYYYGEYYIVNLDKEVYLNPNETFFVRFSYPRGYAYSTGLVKKEEGVIAGRYLYNIESDWYDAALDMESKYGSTGFLVTCLEVSEGQEWIKLLTTETSGTLEPYEMATVTVQVNAAQARLDKNNKAVIVVRSNDPNQPVVNYPIYLDKNGAPEVTAPSNILVKEGTPSTVVLSINDADADSYTVKIDDAEGVVAIDSYVAAETADVTITRVDDTTISVVCNDKFMQPEVQLTLTLNADYGKAGRRSFNVVATDELGNASTTAVSYFVEHVNRAPIAVELADLQIMVNATSTAIDFADLFQDPDGDELTYTMSVADQTVVDVFTAEESVILLGKKLGETTLTVVATDPSGAKATNTLNVIVTDGTGIADLGLDGAVTVYPNPVVDNANISINADVQGDVTYKVYSTSGTMMYSEVAATTTGAIHTIDMSGYAAGIYYLDIEVAGVKTTVSIVKK